MPFNSARPLLLTLIVLVFSITAFAQTAAFTYQGKLSDGSLSASGTYQMQFALFDAATGGAQIGSIVTENSVTVSNGIFSVQLDFGANAFPGADRWLEISVKKPAEATYTTLAPRQKLDSVPYAVRAQKATTADTSTEATTAVNLTGTLSGDVTGTQTATVVESVGGQTSASVAAGVQLANAATSSNTVNTIVKRDANGGFSAGSTSITNNTLTVTATENTDTVMTITNAPLRNDTQFKTFLRLRNSIWEGDTVIDRFKFDNSGGFVANGHLGVGGIPATDSGERMMWYPFRAAFRAGGITGDQWNDSSIGFYSWAGGYNATASGNWAFAFGFNSKAESPYSFVLGRDNTIFIGGEAGFVSGRSNTLCGYAGIALGYGNNSGCSGDLLPGTGPTRTADNMSVAIGYRNVASGNYSVAMGKYASTNGFSGAFVWSDASNTNTDTASTNLFTATANNQFSVKSSGGVRFYTNSTLTTGVTLSANGGSWNTVSDRNAKDNIVAVNPREVLKGVLKLPISTWNYKGQPEFRHIGAMAQDFYQTFKVGESDKTITTVDPDGVAFAAIQGLNEKVDENTANLKKENEALRQKLEQQQVVIESLQKQQTVIDALKKLVCAGNPNADVCK
jgi:hypothetical protein